MDNLLNVCNRLGFAPKKCFEFGAAHPATSQLREFISTGVECHLVEANPRLFYCLKNGYNWGDFQKEWPNVPAAPYTYPGFGNLSNVILYNKAIGPSKGFVKFYERNASSFMGGVVSPAKINDRYNEDEKDSYTVESDVIQSFDDGKIDLLAADVEGSEWYVVENLISRPKLICLETHGGGYVNPNIDKINNWMIKNNYSIYGSTESDTLYLLK